MQSKSKSKYKEKVCLGHRNRCLSLTYEDLISCTEDIALGSLAGAVLDSLLSKIGLSRNSRSPPEEVESLNPSRRYDDLITEKGTLLCHMSLKEEEY